MNVLGDPHALDEGTRLSNTVLRALAALHGEPAPVDAAGRRDLSALHGVTGDELSTTVHVVERPSVLAMAVHRFGPACPPLVCTAGWPNTAAVTR